MFYTLIKHKFLTYRIRILAVHLIIETCLFDDSYSQWGTWPMFEYRGAAKGLKSWPCLGQKYSKTLPCAGQQPPFQDPV